MKTSELFIYPLKSAAAQKVSELRLTSLGPEGDREWMLVDEQGKFLTQRTVPKMAQLIALREPDSFTLGIGKMFVKLSLKNSLQRRIQVKVWNDDTEAALEPDLYSQALSQFLGVSCRLVRHIPEVSKRSLPSVVDNWSPEVRFADGRPILVVNLKSLEDLNSRLAVPVMMDRFRPNIVIEGPEAFAEDHWSRIQIGDVIFSQPKPCTRCKIINIDQKTGEPSSAAEPLKTLSTYRRQEKGVVFGALWIPENSGVVVEGAPVRVLESKK